MEIRWDGPAQVKKLGDDPTKAQISALFAIPGEEKSDSSLPHHAVSSDGKVGAADLDGCVAAIGVLNGARGGVSATAAEKNRAYSHLASHIRALGGTPPAKQFAAARDLELRARRRAGMLRVPERISLQFGASGVEMRAKANGTGGTQFHFTGYATVYDHPFEMWDFWGDEFTEKVAPGSGKRTLANNCDVPFLVGHNDAGIPMARTKSGTMTLGEDTHGLWVDAPGLDGSIEQIRQLASAVERGDMDEMSMAFMTMAQDWSPDYTMRTILEFDLHKGDVSVVVFGANDGTAGSSMVTLPAEQLLLRRPTGIRQRGAGEQRMPTAPYTVHDGEDALCAQCQSANDADAAYCDQCGARMTATPGPSTIAGEDETQQCQACLLMNATDAKYCDQCGIELAGVRPWKSAGISADWWKSAKPSERRAAFEADYTDAPDYDPAPHAAQDAIQCPADGCPVEGGALNAPDAKYCDQCGGSLYDEDGKIVIDDRGVPVEVGAADALTLRHRQLELLRLAG